MTFLFRNSSEYNKASDFFMVENFFAPAVVEKDEDHKIDKSIHVCTLHKLFKINCFGDQNVFDISLKMR